MPKEAPGADGPAPHEGRGAFHFRQADSKEKSIMHYLGGISGNGILICDGKDVARASYDFDGFLRPPTGIISCGEIRLSPSTLQTVFGRGDVQIRTDDGRLLDLRFSEKKLGSAADTAHVDVTGDLPTASPQNWRR
jgi:hypothetical protein